MKEFISKIFVVLICGFAISSCSSGGDDGGSPDPDAYLYVNVEEYGGMIPATGGTVSVSISSNCDWSISRNEIYMSSSTGLVSASHLVSCSMYSGRNDARLTINVPYTNSSVTTTYYIYIDYNGETDFESITLFQSANSTGSDDNTGGNTDDDTDNDTDDGGSVTPEQPSVAKPSAPYGVYASNYGSVTVPDVRITWNEVNGATGYRVYRSTSANGYYSQLGSTSYNYYSDDDCKVGKTYYYKVVAYNSAGTSAYSDYAVFEYKDTRKPGPATYGNCYVSGYTMTINWSVPTHFSYGKPTKALLKVKNPYSNEWAVIQELSGNATSASFSYGAWVDSEGYVYVGIVLENEYGTGGSSAKIYNNNNKTWMN